MSINDTRNTRDKGRPFKLISFNYSNGVTFHYTDSMDAISIINDGKSRLYLSLDCSQDTLIEVGDDGVSRQDIIKSSAIVILQKARAEIANGGVFDVIVSWFAASEDRLEFINATPAQIDSLIAAVTARTVDASSPDLNTAFIPGVAWFDSAPDTAVSRTWIILSGATPSRASLAAAKHTMAPLVTRQGSEGVGFIGTDLYLISCGNPDIVDIRFFDNTPADSIPVIYSSTDTRVVGFSISAKSFVFDPLAMKLDDIEIMASPTKNSIKLVVPKTTDVAKYHLQSRVDSQMFMTIKTGQHGDIDGQLETLFSGRIISVMRDPQKSTVSMTCESLISSMRRNGLGRFYTRSCPHVLYGDKCRADQSKVTSSFKSTLGAWNTSDKRLPFNPGFVLDFDAERYDGGVLWWTENGGVVYRTIIRIEDSRFVLNGPILNAPLADNIFFSIGCNHTPEACRTWHTDSATGQSNGVNYGGQDLIPFANPFKLKSQYY